MRFHNDPTRVGLRSSVFGHSRAPRVSAALLAVAAGLTAIGHAHAQTTVSPVERAIYEGSSSTSYPLGRFNARVQQLHADLGITPLTVQGHAYRRDAISTRGQVGSYRVEMAVTLSMSPNAPDQASRTFASNVGAPVVVLPRTWLDFPATNRPAQAPAPTFELRVPYATPFAYPAGGGTLCVDTVLHGNQSASGINANFTAYLDAQEQFRSGQAEQPGYRFGQGCTAPGASSAAYASYELRRRSTSMEFDIAARNGMRTNAAGTGYSFLMFGMQPSSQAFWLRPGCQLLTSMEFVMPLAGGNDAAGHWNGTLAGFAPLPEGTAFYAQIASAHPIDGVVLGDASHVTAPPAGPVPITVARIAHGTDRTSPTGSVSLTVPVTELF